MEQFSLPEKYEEFSEARRKGFLDVMEIKKQGGILAGVFCAYTPGEILHAAGITSVGLCGTDPETIPDAERDLPKNLCPLIKSSYGFALTDKCPYFYFSDIIIGETTCDGKKKMYELLGDMGKNVYLMQLPQGVNREYAVSIWKTEILRLKEHLEEQFGVEITDEKVREAARLLNRQRRNRLTMFELQKSVPPPMYGSDMIVVAEGDSFKFDVDLRNKAIEDLIHHIKAEYDAGKRVVPASAKRIMLTGCPLGGVVKKVCHTIENSGGVIVVYDTCAGTRATEIMVDEVADDIYEAIAERHLGIGCSVMSDNRVRIESIPRLVEDYQVDGIIEVVLQACHTFNIEAVRIKQKAKELNIPYIKLEVDYSQSDVGQISTRVEAFMEMI